MSSAIVALPATDAEALKQRLDALVASTSSSLVLMPSDIVALPATDAEVPKQWLDALVAAAEAAEEKATAAHRRVLAAADLERQAAAKKLVPGSTSSSTTETATTSLSYVDTIIANFHIQADTMMEEIHLDTSDPAAAPMTFYSNKMPPLAPPRPPGKNNGSGPGNGNGNGSNNNRNRNNNRRNGGSGDKNSNTTVASHSTTTNDGRGPPPWPTYVNRRRGTLPCTPARRPPASSGRRLSWPRRGHTPHRALSLGSSSCTSRPLLRLLRAGHPGTVRAGTSSRS
jgi:hypothetical protein